MLNLKPMDLLDPEAASTAVFVDYPDTLTEKALEAAAYFDDTAFLFQYKGRLVLTDESLWLTEAGDGSRDNPFGFPRWVGDTCEELNAWLEAVADDLKEAGIL